MTCYSVCYYFWGQRCSWTETNIIGNDVLFFISFHCPQLFYCSPCPTAAPGSLNMHVVSTNFAKTLVANLNMPSCCDVTNSVYPVTMTTIRHCSILEFGRGASHQALARASPDLCTPLPVSLSFICLFRKIIPPCTKKINRCFIGNQAEILYSLEKILCNCTFFFTSLS